jgi:hypothetical protein
MVHIFHWIALPGGLASAIRELNAAWVCLNQAREANQISKVKISLVARKNVGHYADMEEIDVCKYLFSPSEVICMKALQSYRRVSIA